MTREIEIEIPDQSDVVPRNILKGKKHDVDKLINDLPAISSNYTPIQISHRDPMPHESFRRKPPDPVSIISVIFLLFAP